MIAVTIEIKQICFQKGSLLLVDPRFINTPDCYPALLMITSQKFLFGYIAYTRPGYIAASRSRYVENKSACPGFNWEQAVYIYPAVANLRPAAGFPGSQSTKLFKVFFGVGLYIGRWVHRQRFFEIGKRIFFIALGEISFT